MENMDREQIVHALYQNKITPEEALRLLEPRTDIVRWDDNRVRRRGFPESVLAEAKTVSELVAIGRQLRVKGPPVLFTRLSAAKARHLQAAFPAVPMQYFSRGRILVWGPMPQPHPTPTVAVVTAGTGDLPVAEEARVTLAAGGISVVEVADVGVAGLHRLINAWETIRPAQVIIVVAGMDGALPSVVAGLADRPVIAVPTSVGYGANFGGLAPLLTMLNSCAEGVGVVNIDNGFGAARLAALMLRIGPMPDDVMPV